MKMRRTTLFSQLYLTNRVCFGILNLIEKTERLEEEMMVDITREALLSKGFRSIGNKGNLEYLAKEGEFGEILYIPVQNDKAIGIVQSIPEDVLDLLFKFVSN